MFNSAWCMALGKFIDETGVFKKLNFRETVFILLIIVLLYGQHQQLNQIKLCNDTIYSINKHLEQESLKLDYMHSLIQSIKARESDEQFYKRMDDFFKRIKK